MSGIYFKALHRPDNKAGRIALAGPLLQTAIQTLSRIEEHSFSITTANEFEELLSFISARMLQFGKKQKEKETCFVTHGTMGHLDPTQPPTKRKPYASVLSMPCISKAEIILPKSVYDATKDSFMIIKPAYSRVTLPLSAILEGDFFTEYIKKGNVLMLSEGVHGVDNVYSLQEGILTLALDKESYERAGLVGKPDGAKGSRGARARWVVEINLRLPSMLHGKKGFDRMVYGVKNVLDKPVTWLFCNIGDAAPSPDPLDKHSPIKFDCEPEVVETAAIRVPLFQPPTAPSDVGVDDFADFTTDIYEWLSLGQLESPRVDANDRIDSYLSRYSMPEASPDSIPETLVRLSWSGFLAPSWAHKAFVQCVLAASSKSWFAFAATGFQASMPAGPRDCTVLKIPGKSSDFLLWEVERN